MKDIDEYLKYALKGNRVYQSKIYKILLPYLNAVGRRYLQDVSYLPDALQDSFVSIFKNLDKYDKDKGELKTWATRITINTCFNFNSRVSKPYKELDSEIIDVKITNKVLEMLDAEDVLRRLKKMPEIYYTVFNLFIIEGFRHEEISEMLNISIDVSRKRLSRARLWVAEKMEAR